MGSRTLLRLQQRQVLRLREPEPSRVSCHPRQELQQLSLRSITEWEQARARNRLLAPAVRRPESRFPVPQPPSLNSRPQLARSPTPVSAVLGQPAVLPRPDIAVRGLSPAPC